LVHTKFIGAILGFLFQNRKKRIKKMGEKLKKLGLKELLKKKKDLR
jgi:hypothetical protein